MQLYNVDSDKKVDSKEYFISLIPNLPTSFFDKIESPTFKEMTESQRKSLSLLFPDLSEVNLHQIRLGEVLNGSIKLNHLDV